MAPNLDLNDSFSSRLGSAAWCACDWNPRTTTSTRWRRRRTSTRAATTTSSTPAPGMGGWVRMGNRPNEGYAEMTVCLYLPDGRVGVHVQAAADRRPRRARRRRPALRGGRAVRGAPRHLRRQGVRARAARARWPIPKSAFNDNPHAPCTDRPRPQGRRPAVGRRAGVGRGRGEARPRSREDVRPRPHRAAHGDHRHGHGRRRDVRRSPTRSACATTRGARASGRASGGTAGSP